MFWKILEKQKFMHIKLLRTGRYVCDFKTIFQSLPWPKTEIYFISAFPDDQYMKL